ncbi:MAG: hypothetical protein UV82_C0005G0011 [Candidatus Magasanikbacteria bacterium GW2011_GWD2_43_18]|uniref:Uncharacterized protein n=1 Tax=Candidatus Magasanikbacteria bacterium GW2011_GWE2_42_7 TaxID=1619052 RepID=A0A0G1BBT1_9BACT|nr:MAG: hypothetical protein UV18_C0005G0194 [Candidatus Magasanikbacteria bacterium GW2011_GWC2_42_27]KKS70835.1 MAG: hypothetical protein UV42_C0042G0007 [Candidatus Magasanikbacteria bacterium GW2011_GWE2_42_7]KKT04773.1 MAG: hypothetical protein UV82_C0005G0011 [Candidatus Magasanikbacteria bacterium GW2011_GWD2_43_18]KKT25870.1 MAG: hypothetical protein UW10_C0003G0031 [Candidatus Magasanikbacteria bacterium GW2011_GWA2_43_9]HBB37851.1 hypothetical protein [Candidatus Magasanikbacteria bac
MQFSTYMYLEKWLNKSKKCVTWGKGVDSVDIFYLRIRDNADVLMNTSLFALDFITVQVLTNRRKTRIIGYI